MGAYPTPDEMLTKRPQSLRTAINAQCITCSGDSRKEVRFCTALSCSLWHVRPYQIKEVNLSTINGVLEETNSERMKFYAHRQKRFVTEGEF